VLATNLDGAFLTFRELGRHMKERGGGGKLVAVSSISALSATPPVSDSAFARAFRNASPAEKSVAELNAPPAKARGWGWR